MLSERAGVGECFAAVKHMKGMTREDFVARLYIIRQLIVYLPSVRSDP